MDFITALRISLSVIIPTILLFSPPITGNLRIFLSCIVSIASLRELVILIVINGVLITSEICVLSDVRTQIQCLFL